MTGLDIIITLVSIIIIRLSKKTNNIKKSPTYIIVIFILNPKITIMRRIIKSLVLLVLLIAVVSCQNNKNTQSNNSIEGDMTGTFTDKRDSTEYKWVRIGDQVWMAENLAYKPTEGKYWAYDNDQNNVAKYGYLYDWETAKKVCPPGWHLPTDAEWRELEMYLGMSRREANDTGRRGSDEGGKLKETGTTHWSEPNEGATNESGFTALPGGHRYGSGGFNGIGDSGTWWSATERDTYNAWSRSVSYPDSNVYKESNYKEYGVSVRCLRDY